MRVRSAAFLRLREALTDARLYRGNRGPFLSNKLRELSISAADLEVLDRALARELIVLVEVNRASDIRTVVEIGNEFGLRVPPGLGALHSREDAARILHQAGVRVVLADLGSPHFAHRLRQAAGNAVRAGLPYDAAIASLTAVPAALFGVPDSGVLRAGAAANVVLWSGDPLEVTSWAERMWIRGQEVSLQTRQDLLTERYKR